MIFEIINTENIIAGGFAFLEKIPEKTNQKAEFTCDFSGDAFSDVQAI